MFMFVSELCPNFPLSSFFKLSSCVSLQSEKRSSNFMYLMVEFPRVKANDKEYSIVYYEKVSRAFRNAAQDAFSRELAYFIFVPTQDGDDDSPILTSCDIVKVPDPQMGMVRDIKIK